MLECGTTVHVIIAKRMTPMADHQPFLQAILANPNDDAPRLIYADWLEEQGDVARAEFIRVQCAMAKYHVFDPARLALMVRGKELQAVHQNEWLGEARQWMQGWTFARGFVEKAALYPNQFLKHVERLFAREPVRWLRLLRAGRSMGKILANGALARLSRLTTLDLSHNEMGNEATNQLVLSPQWATLRVLNLADNTLEDSGIIPLLTVPWVAQIQ